MPPSLLLGFGVEIEAIVVPLEPDDLSKAEWYSRFAQFLRGLSLPAIADELCSGYKKHPQHYDKWFITSDRSIDASKPGQSKYPLCQIPLLSP